MAQDYVDFIKIRPWYEFDFVGPMRELWATPAARDGNLLRKWERRYMLTSEFAVKAAYAKLIELGTRSSYDVPIEQTYSVVAAPTGTNPGALPPEARLVAKDGAMMLLDLPRRQEYADVARSIARGGYNFTEIAGNRDEILVTFIGRRAPALGGREIYRQPILTRPGEWRYALAYRIVDLGDVLRSNEREKMIIEHIYDY